MHASACIGAARQGNHIHICWLHVLCVYIYIYIYIYIYMHACPHTQSKASSFFSLPVP